MSSIARFALGFMLLLAGVARAGDVIPFDFGAPIPLEPKSARNIVLQSETFRAQIFYDYATSSATYRFRNEGAATTVAMAFPGDLPRGGNDASKSSFQVRVDGKTVKFRRETKGEMFDSQTRYLGRVRFERGQSRVMQVAIRTQKFWSLGFGADLEYAFAGPKWKGETRSDIGVEVRAPGAFIVSGFRSDSADFDTSSAVALEAKENRCRFVGNEARGFLTFALDATLLPDWLTREGNENKARTIRVPGLARGFYSAAFWAPPALVKAGVTYFNLHEFAEESLRDESNARVNLDWNEDVDRCTLSVGNHKLQVTKGSRNARLDGRAFELRAAPFTATAFDHDGGEGEVMYVPLLDIARALGATANVNQKAHRFSLKLPKP